MSNSENRITQTGLLLFYLGAILAMGFLMWATVAPYRGADPEWWNPAMGKAAALALLLMMLSVVVLVYGFLKSPGSDLT